MIVTKHPRRHPIAADGGSGVTVGQSLADFLRHERVPAGLIDRLDYIASPGPAGSWPPRPGCCEHRDIGIVRGLGDN